MRIPEPEEDKVTATDGGLRTSGLLKPAASAGASWRKVCLYYSTTVCFNRKFSCSIFKQPSQHTLVYTWLTRSYSSRRHQLSTCLCARPHCACVCLVNMNGSLNTFLWGCPHHWTISYIILHTPDWHYQCDVLDCTSLFVCCIALPDFMMRTEVIVHQLHYN